MKKKWLRLPLTAVYAVGSYYTLFLLAEVFLNFLDYYRNTNNSGTELAFVVMAAGFPWMLFSALSILWCWQIRYTVHPRRNRLLILLPAILDGIPFVYCTMIFTTAFIQNLLGI